MGQLDVQYIVEQIIASKKQPITDLETYQVFYEAKRTAFQNLNTKVSALESAIYAASSTGFNSKLATSSNTDYLVVSASATAQSGENTLYIRQLASAQSNTSASFASGAAALGASTFSITQNGTTFSYDTTGKTLADLKGALNNSGLDISATILNYGTGDYRLQVRSTASGTANTFRISDSGNNTYFNATAKTATFQSATGSVLTTGQVFSITDGTNTYNAPGAGGTIDSSTSSLTGLASDINTNAASWLTASVRTEGSNSYLEIVPKTTGKELTITDSGVGTNIQFGKIAARDAQINVNSNAPEDVISRSSNSISDLIEGVTLNLKKADAAVPIALTVGADTATLKTNIQDFVTKFNELADFLNSQFAYDTENERAGVLSGESAARKVQMDMLSIASSRVQGLDESDPYKTLSVIGIATDKEGKLQIDDAKLSAALSDQLDSVKRIFKNIGSSTSADLSYVGKSKATVAGNYSVTVTTAAAQARVQAGQDVPGGGLAQDESLTITYNNKDYTVNLTTGQTLNNVVATINTALQNQHIGVTASANGGALVLNTDDYGAGQTVKVVSNVAAGANGTGFGTTLLTGSGADVAGKFTKEGVDYTATGSGQLLTGTSGDAKGLMVFATASTTGNQGDIFMTYGVAESLRVQMSELSFPFTGVIDRNIASLDTQLLNITDKIRDITTQLAKEQDMLITQFSQANEALAQMQYLQSTLSGMK